MGTAHGAEELGLCPHGRACQAGVYGHYIGFSLKKVAVDTSRSLARTFHDWSIHQGRALCETTSITWRFLQSFLKRCSKFTNSRVAYFGFLMRNGSSNASIDGHKGPTLDWWAAECSVDMVSPKTTRTDAIWSPITPSAWPIPGAPCL
jgi:hypothetical protein